MNFKIGKLVSEKPTRNNDLFTFFSLYIAQSLPMSFFSTALQVTMRQASFSLSAIALLQLIKLPWILKFIWAPWVDRSCQSLKGFRHCIFISEGIYALLIFVIGYLDLISDFHVVIVLIICSFIASATQDIATDALAVLSFKKEERSLVNGVQSLGSFAATLIGSGFLLMLLHHYGWHVVVPFLAVFVGIALWPLYKNRGIHIDKQRENREVGLSDFYGFFTNSKNLRQTLFLLLYYASTISILSVVRPWLVDMGYDMKEIGFFSGILGSSAACLGAIVSGKFTHSYGIKVARGLFAFISMLTAGVFVLVSLSQLPSWAIISVVVLLWASYGTMTVVVYTSAMEHVRKGLEGTDFTVQTVVTHFSGIIFSVISGHIAEAMGYTIFFTFAMCIALTSLVYVIMMKN